MAQWLAPCLCKVTGRWVPASREGMQCPLPPQLDWAVAGRRVGQDVLQGLSVGLAFLWPPVAVAGESSSKQERRRASWPMPSTPLLLRVEGPLPGQSSVPMGIPAVHTPGGSPQAGRPGSCPPDWRCRRGSGQDTPCQDRASACGMSGLERRFPQQEGAGPCLPTSSTRLWSLSQGCD